MDSNTVQNFVFVFPLTLTAGYSIDNTLFPPYTRTLPFPQKAQVVVQPLTSIEHVQPFDKKKVQKISQVQLIHSTSQ